MKTLVIAASLAVLMATPALAGSKAISNSNSSSTSVAVSNAQSSGNTTSFQDQRQAPGVSVAGLAASGGCLGSATAGVSFPGGGFAFGGTMQDDRCNAREDARLIAAMGYKRQAMQILINNSPMIRQVFEGDTVPVAGRPVVTSRRAVVAGGAGCQILSKSGNGQCLD